MKQIFLSITMVLTGSIGLATESLECMVQKFDGQTYNISKNDEIKFKGMIDTNKVMIIDEATGVTTVADTVDGSYRTPVQIGVVLTLGDLVIVSNPVKKVEAIGNKSAILVDHNTGLAIICAKK